MKKEYDFRNAKRGQVVIPKGKTRITIYIDNDVLERFRSRADDTGYGYQTMINEALREYLNQPHESSLNESTLRKVVREELKRAAHQ